MTIDDLLEMDREKRDEIELRVARNVADELLRRLPADDTAHEALRRQGYDLARRMSWDVVVRDYFLPALERAMHKHRVIQVA